MGDAGRWSGEWQGLLRCVQQTRPLPYKRDGGRIVPLDGRLTQHVVLYVYSVVNLYGTQVHA